MKYTIVPWLVAAGLGASCAGESLPQPAPMTKEEALAQLGSADIDACEYWSFYGDGECDTFCLEPDPDCEPEEPEDPEDGCQGEIQDELILCLDHTDDPAGCLDETTAACCDSDPSLEWCVATQDRCNELRDLYACIDTNPEDCDAEYSPFTNLIHESCCEAYPGEYDFCTPPGQ